MKKEYIAPKTGEIRIQTTSILAGSLPKSDTEITGAGEILSREFGNESIGFSDDDFDFWYKLIALYTKPPQGSKVSWGGFFRF